MAIEAPPAKKRSLLKPRSVSTSSSCHTCRVNARQTQSSLGRNNLIPDQTWTALPHHTVPSLKTSQRIPTSGSFFSFRPRPARVLSTNRWPRLHKPRKTRGAIAVTSAPSIASACIRLTSLQESCASSACAERRGAATVSRLCHGPNPKGPMGRRVMSQARELGQNEPGYGQFQVSRDRKRRQNSGRGFASELDMKRKWIPNFNPFARWIWVKIKPPGYGLDKSRF